MGGQYVVIQNTTGGTYQSPGQLPPSTDEIGLLKAYPTPGQYVPIALDPVSNPSSNNDTNSEPEWTYVDYFVNTDVGSQHIVYEDTNPGFTIIFTACY